MSSLSPWRLGAEQIAPPLSLGERLTDLIQLADVLGDQRLAARLGEVYQEWLREQPGRKREEVGS